MDALSEKSPHQSSSPLAADPKRSESPLPASQHHQQHHVSKGPPVVTPSQKMATSVTTIQPTKTHVINVDDFTNIGDIEIALAKMEGITTCDTNSLMQHQQQQMKLNGDHTAIVRSSKHELSGDIRPSSANTIILCAPNIEQKIPNHRDDEVKKSVDYMHSTLQIRDMNENKEQLASVVVLDDCCAKSNNPNIITIVTGNDELKKLSTTCLSDTIESDIAAKQELIDQLKDDDSKAIIKIEKLDTKLLMSSDDHTDDHKKSLSSETSMDQHKDEPDSDEVLSQLSIEIPGGDVPRIRTRASSKLESPLDIQQKASPSESPAVVMIVGSTPSNTAGSSSTTTVACSSAVKSLKLGTVDRLSPKIAGKAIKRKRQGSESSTQSSVSDDMPGSTTSSNRAKKARKTTIENVTITITTSSTASAATTVVTTTTTTVAANPQPNATSVTVTKQPPHPSTHQQPHHQLHHNKKVVGDAVKNNHMKPQIDQRSTLTMTTGTGTTINHVDAKKSAEESSDSDEPLIEIAKLRNSKLVKTASDNTDKVLRNHHRPVNTSSTTTSKGAATGAASNHTNSTAGNVVHVASVAVTSTGKNTLPHAKIAPSIHVDDKSGTIMSTRRSVRMTMNAAQSKGAAAAIHLSEELKKSTSIGIGGGHKNSVTSEQDARRKTRSAGELSNSFNYIRTTVS